jgi:hypothetical protein
MEQGSLFPDPRPAVTDEELVAVFRGAISRGGRLSRMADLYLNAVCAEHLVHELRVAGMEVVRRLRCGGFRGENKCRAKPSRVNLVEVSHHGKSWRKLREVVVVDVQAAQLATMPV